jgi:catechol 2,3-dioxygenase
MTADNLTQNLPGEPGAHVRPAVPVLNHFVLKTTRKDEMVEWYKSVLGMVVKFDSPFGTFLSNDDANHRLALLTFPGITPDPERRLHDGLYHTSFEYERFADLNASYLRLRDIGITPAVCIDHRMTFSYYYVDPDGNLVEVQVDSFGDWAASTAYMNNELLEVTNGPLGILFDPELVAKDVAGGVSFDEIRKRCEEGRYRTLAEFEPDLHVPPPAPGAPSMFKVWDS